MTNIANKLFVLLACVIACSVVDAQVSSTILKQKKQELLQQRENMSKEQIREIYKSSMHRVPNSINKQKLVSKSLIDTKTSDQKLQKALEVPEDMIFPIESDEVQAILMSWGYDTRTLSGATAEPMFEGWGLTYDMFGNPSLVQTVSVPDVASNSDFAKVFANLANAIQKHAQVWIDVWAADDTTTIKDFMAQRGTPLTNYRFFIHPSNAFWARDYGPVAFYYGDNDSIAFMDFEYYGGRPLDDKIPIELAKDLGWKCYTNSIEYEGGNILLDGVGSLFTTSALYENNKDTYGQYYMDTTNGGHSLGFYTKTALTEEQIRDSLRHLLNLRNVVVVPALSYDGGTGHIDLYADMWEETGFVAGQYPDGITNASLLKDAQRVETNLDTFTSQLNYFGDNYSRIRVPLPRKDDGTWYTSGANYNRYTRCYANHTFVNDAIIQPVFYDTTKTGTDAGDVEGNKRAMNVLKTCYPGYRFEEIDVREFDGFGGAIHCITKQIPAENPIRIYHQPTHWFNTTQNGGSINIQAIAQNHSGISGVKLYYMTNEYPYYTEVEMTNEGDNLYSYEVPLSVNVDVDTLRYYFEATSNNGKTITKPMTVVHGGCYSMPFGKNVTTYNNSFAYDTLADVGLKDITKQELDNISEIYPNPAVDNATITINNSADIYYRIVNLKGQNMQMGKISQGTNTYKFNTEKLKAGNYWVIFTDGNLSTARKLVIAK